MALLDLQDMETRSTRWADEDSSLSVLLCGDSSLSITDCN